MKWSRLICLAALASQLVASEAAADRAAATPDGNSGPAKVPPVLRPFEPRDSWQVTLPGPAPAAPAPEKVTLPSPTPVAPVVKPAPAAAPEPAPAKPVQDATLRRPLPLLLPAAQVKPSPPSLQIGREVAAYCQKQIGHWKEDDARKLLGEPKRHRPAFDEKKSVNGTIYAYTDPTNKYKELELDFDLQTGSLRTVFVYPPRLTWEQCRRLWNGPVSAADAARGRKFYSYTNRRLDVLVDPTGNVISLGWY
jgi:hypothetical protein